MTRNEFQLRAALRDGEGENIDPDTVIMRARAVTQARRDRRVRYLSVAAVVAVVGGIGTVAGLALTGGNSGQSNSSANGQGKAANSDARSGATAPSVGKPIAGGPMARAAAIPCPATAPALKLPGGGGSGQFGANGSLFSGPVESVKICAYQQQDRSPIKGADGQTMTTAVIGPQASALAASLDAAPKSRPRTPCPLYLAADGKTLVIIGVSADSHQPMRPITTVVGQNPCGQATTNGTAIRYNWSAPGSLTPFIAKLPRSHGGGPVTGTPNGSVTGSPIHS